MKNLEKIEQFIANNDESTIKDYHDKLFENLTVLNNKEDKLILWQIIIFFFYLFAGNVKLNNFTLGPVSINDTSIAIKLLPIVFIYVFYDLHSVSYQKQEIVLAFDLISRNRFDKKFKKEEFNTFLTRIYRPYSVSNSIIKLIREKADLPEVILGGIILLPLMIIAILPYIVGFLMIIDIYNNHINDLLGKISFCISIWLIVIIIYQFIVKILIYKEEGKV